MANPPAIVKTTLESICLLLGEGTSSPADWKTIRSVIMRENFITTIVNFNTDDITLVSFLAMFGWLESFIRSIRRRINWQMQFN